MTDQADRRRGLLVMLAVFVPLTVVATASTPENRLFTAVAMTAAFTVLVVIVMAMWTYRPAWFATWKGPLKDLGPEDRRRVTRAVSGGEALADPELAEAAWAVARGSARAAWLMIGAGSVNLAFRAWSLADARTAAGRVLAVWNALLWLAWLAYAVHRLSRARRAEAANRPAGSPSHPVG